MRYVVTIATTNMMGTPFDAYMSDHSSLEAAFYEVYKIERNYRIMGKDLLIKVYDRKEQIFISKEDYENRRYQERPQNQDESSEP